MMRWVIAVALVGAAASPLVAKPKLVAGPPAGFGRLLACRGLSESAARLACFDREARAVGEAVARRDIVVVDREAVGKTRRSLFGLALPDLGIFGDDGSDALKQIDGVIAGVSTNRDGGYVFSLADGSRWTQIDDRPIAIEPRGGDKVIVRKAALGSYMLSVGRQPDVRVRRID